jgi:hypothetical protein
VVAGLIATGLIVAACGGSSPSSAKPAASTRSDSALAFSRCMREHGVKEFPNPEISDGQATLRVKNGGPGGLRVNPQIMEAAQSACRHLLKGSEPKLSPQEKVAREEQVLRFARCMREHGIDVHASTSGGGVQIGIQGRAGSGGPNPESPAFQAAQKACQGLLPFKGPGPRGGPAPGAANGGKSGAGTASSG